MRKNSLFKKQSKRDLEEQGFQGAAGRGPLRAYRGPYITFAFPIKLSKIARNLRTRGNND